MSEATSELVHTSISTPREGKSRSAGDGSEVMTMALRWRWELPLYHSTE